MSAYTQTEWKQELKELAEKCSARYPLVRFRVSKSELELDAITDSLSGSLQLHIARGSFDYMVPRVRIGSSKTIGHSMEEVSLSLSEARQLHNALSYLIVQTSRMNIYMKNCPCRHCGGNERFKKSCKLCNGKGHRHDEE